MNMRAISMACAGLAAIAVIVTATMWRELRVERERAAALQSPVEPAPPERIEVIPPAPPVVAATPQPVLKPPTTAPAPISDATGAKPQPDDADHRKTRLLTLRARLMQTYPGLAKALNLTDEENERFFDMMAETQLALEDQRNSLRSSGTSEADIWNSGELWRNREATQRRQADALHEMLGDARYEKWLEYQPTRSSRLGAGSFASVLADAGAPLSSDQLGSLQTAVAAEEKSLGQDTVAIGRTVDAANPQSQKLAQEALKNRRLEGNQRVLDGIAPYLTTEQQGLLRVHVEQQAVVNRALADAQQRAKESPPQQQ